MYGLSLYNTLNCIFKVAQLRAESLRREIDRTAQQQNPNQELNNEFGDEELIAKPASSRKGRGRGRGRGKAKVVAVPDEDFNEEEDGEFQQSVTRGRGRGRGRAQTTTASKRGRPRTAKRLNSTLDVIISPSKPPPKVPTTSRVLTFSLHFFTC